jgi:hypothetical protein
VSLAATYTARPHGGGRQRRSIVQVAKSLTDLGFPGQVARRAPRGHPWRMLVSSAHRKTVTSSLVLSCPAVILQQKTRATGDALPWLPSVAPTATEKPPAGRAEGL